MTDCDDHSHEHVDAEINTVKLCPGCSSCDMIIRDPRQLPHESVFAYDPWCGLTYFVRLVGDST